MNDMMLQPTTIEALIINTKNYPNEGIKQRGLLFL